MPYYVYKIIPGPANLLKNLEKLDETEKFKEAKNTAKQYRIDLDLTSESEIEIKIIFAENPLDAEEKLMEKREKPILREWEK